MTLHLRHPGRDPEKEGCYPHSILYPPCAGASSRWFEKCPRCGATMDDRCGDDDAYAAQNELLSARRRNEERVG